VSSTQVKFYSSNLVLIASTLNLVPFSYRVYAMIAFTGDNRVEINLNFNKVNRNPF